MTHSIFLVHSPLYCITLIHCFIRAVVISDWMQFSYDLTHSIILMHSHSYFITLIIVLLVQLKKIDNSKLSAFFLNTEYNFRTIWLIPYFYALTFIHHHCHSDWFQLNMSTFSTCALIQGHQKTGTKISQPISQIFLKLNSSVKNLLFELCTRIFYIKCIHICV